MSVKMDVKLEDSAPYEGENNGVAGKDSAKTQCSLQRIRGACKTIAKRRASNRRIKELWYAGCVR